MASLSIKQSSVTVLDDPVLSVLTVVPASSHLSSTTPLLVSVDLGIDGLSWSD